jgi:hypothetical protein
MSLCDQIVFKNSKNSNRVDPNVSVKQQDIEKNKRDKFIHDVSSRDTIKTLKKKTWQFFLRDDSWLGSGWLISGESSSVPCVSLSCWTGLRFWLLILFFNVHFGGGLLRRDFLLLFWRTWKDIKMKSLSNLENIAEVKVHDSSFSSNILYFFLIRLHLTRHDKKKASRRRCDYHFLSPQFVCSTGILRIFFLYFFLCKTRSSRIQVSKSSFYFMW